MHEGNRFSATLPRLSTSRATLGLADAPRRVNSDKSLHPCKSMCQLSMSLYNWRLDTMTFTSGKLRPKPAELHPRAAGSLRWHGDRGADKSVPYCAHSYCLNASQLERSWRNSRFTNIIIIDSKLSTAVSTLRRTSSLLAMQAIAYRRSRVPWHRNIRCLRLKTDTKLTEKVDEKELKLKFGMHMPSKAPVNRVSD